MKSQIFQSNWRKVLAAPLVVGILLTLAACGGGKKSGLATGGGFVPGCTNCPVGSGTLLAAALANWQGPGFAVQLGMRIHEPQAAYPPNAYYGPVQASGYMLVSGPTGACTPLPIGKYQIATLPPNGMYAPDLSYYPWNLQAFDFDVVHTSGFRARVHVDYAEFYAQPLVTGADGGTYPHGMYGQVTVAPLTGPVGGCYPGAVSLFFPKY